MSINEIAGYIILAIVAGGLIFFSMDIPKIKEDK